MAVAAPTCLSEKVSGTDRITLSIGTRHCLLELVTETCADGVHPAPPRREPDSAPRAALQPVTLPHAADRTQTDDGVSSSGHTTVFRGGAGLFSPAHSLLTKSIDVEMIRLTAARVGFPTPFRGSPGPSPQSAAVHFRLAALPPTSWPAYSAGWGWRPSILVSSGRGGFRSAGGQPDGLPCSVHTPLRPSTTDA